MRKHKYEDWEALQLGITKEAGKRLDAAIKRRLHEVINDMYLGSEYDLYRMENLRLLQALKPIFKDAGFLLTTRKGELEFQCWLFECDEEFVLRFRIKDVLKNELEWRSGECKEDHIEFIKALRDAADQLEAAFKC